MAKRISIADTIVLRSAAKGYKADFLQANARIIGLLYRRILGGIQNYHGVGEIAIVVPDTDSKPREKVHSVGNTLEIVVSALDQERYSLKPQRRQKQIALDRFHEGCLTAAEFLDSNCDKCNEAYLSIKQLIAGKYYNDLHFYETDYVYSPDGSTSFRMRYQLELHLVSGILEFFDERCNENYKVRSFEITWPQMEVGGVSEIIPLWIDNQTVEIDRGSFLITIPVGPIKQHWRKLEELRSEIRAAEEAAREKKQESLADGEDQSKSANFEDVNEDEHDPWNCPDHRHPRAARLMQDELLWDCANELAPFGSDEGSDAYAEYRRWRKDNQQSNLASCISWILEGKEEDYNENLLKDSLIKMYVSGQDCEDAALLGLGYPDVFTLDATIIATVLGQLVDEGSIDVEVKPYAEIAVRRQLHPLILNEYNRNSIAEERKYILNLVMEVLRQA